MVISEILGSAIVNNAIADFLVYGHYLKQASESMKFAALVISSIKETEDLSSQVNFYNR